MRDAAQSVGPADGERVSAGSDHRTSGASNTNAAPVDYAAMLAAQGGVCAICGRPPKTKRLHVDHDHRTGRIRGLLCFTCNHFILGKYATVAKLRAAADYLERGGVA